MTVIYSFYFSEYLSATWLFIKVMDLGKETGLEWFSGGDIQYILFKPYSYWHYFTLQFTGLLVVNYISNFKDFECVLITVYPNTRHCRSAPQTHSLQTQGKISRAVTFDKLAHLGCFLMSRIPLWQDRSLDVWCWQGEVRLRAFWENIMEQASKGAWFFFCCCCLLLFDSSFEVHYCHPLNSSVDPVQSFLNF